MRSKLALRLLKEVANKEHELEFNSILDLVNIINKDLERLEALEDNETIVTNYTFNLIQENEKLKKAIKILKDKLDISIFDVFLNITIDLKTLKLKHLTQQEYELLKEVLASN